MGLVDIFSKMKEASLSLQRKHLTVFVANNKIQVLKMTLKSLETYDGHHELDSFPTLKGFSDEISGDINKYDFFIVYGNVPQLYNSKLIFSK